VAIDSSASLPRAAQAVVPGRARPVVAIGPSAVPHRVRRKAAGVRARIVARADPLAVPARAAGPLPEEKVREDIRSSSSIAVPWAAQRRGERRLARLAAAGGSSALQVDAVPRLAREPVARYRETRAAATGSSVVPQAGWGSAPRIAVAVGRAAQRADGRRRPQGAVHRARRRLDARAEEILHADDVAGPRLKS
jgi:hypothetical protein